MSDDESTGDGAKAFDDVISRVLAAHPGDETGRMFHSPGLRMSGKFYAFATGDDVIVKLPEKRVGAIIAGGDGIPCEPRPGRPMREWVCLVAPTADDCESWVLEARAFVVSLRG